ncbi:g1882 [Coccomyxa elongata]
MAGADALLAGGRSFYGEIRPLRRLTQRTVTTSRSCTKVAWASSAVSLEREAAIINEAALESNKAIGALDFDLQVQDMSKTVLGIILGGGAGSRLYPLTKKRAKPAVPLGANYRLVDIPVSNCINSNVNKIYCLTQFNSASLNRHLSQAYNANVGGYSSRGFVEVLAASQSPIQKKWFQGTADAVRQYLWLFENSMREGVEDFLILAGDHLYRMNYQDFVLKHRKTGADITVAALPSDEKKATAFGLMKIDDTGRIIDFAEKPKGDALKAMRVDTTILGLDPERAKEEPYIASMGIYVAKASAIRDLLLNHFPEANDFGSEVIPGAKDMGMHIQAYLYDGYWEDIGTVEAFYEANLALTDNPTPKFSFYDRDAPIYTMSRFLPPSKVQDSEVNNSILGDGCVIRAGSRINHSVIGLRALINENCTVDDALIMGADYYETLEECALVPGCLPMGLGANTTVRKCIIDKNARIGSNCKIINSANVQEANKEEDGYVIKDGIIVVIKGTVFPDGTVI